MPSLALLDSFYRERNYNCPVYLSDLHRDAEREKQAIAQDVRILKRRR
jgi:hypothetical protein